MGGRRQQPENQKYYTDPKVREKYRYYITNSGDAEHDRIPGTKRHASQPRTGVRDGEKQAFANDVQSGHAGMLGKPASACGGGYGQPRSETSRRSKSSVKSSAVSERSFSGYSGSVVESAARNNPFGRRQSSVCSSGSSRAPSQSSYAASHAPSESSRRSSRTPSGHSTK